MLVQKCLETYGMHYVYCVQNPLLNDMRISKFQNLQTPLDFMYGIIRGTHLENVRFGSLYSSK